MKIGFNMFLWTGHVNSEHIPILNNLKQKGYDGVQIPVLEGNEEHFYFIKKQLDDIGLEATALTILPEVKFNLLSADSKTRQQGIDYLKWAIDCTSALSSKQLCGPLHQTLGYFSGESPILEERKRVLECHRQIGDYAQAQNIQIVLEAVNRFESYFVNTIGGLCDYLTELDHQAFTGMYDTFHANLEEKQPTECIKSARKWIGHVHISENDRGTPGKGHIDWHSVFKTLKEINYDGWLTIESFSRSLPQLAAATKIWRDVSSSLDEVWNDGFDLIRQGWDAV